METFSAFLAFFARNSPVTGEFPSQSLVTRRFDVFFIYAWTNGWVNNRYAGDMRRHHAHSDVTVMVYGKTHPPFSGKLSEHVNPLFKPHWASSFSVLSMWLFLLLPLLFLYFIIDVDVMVCVRIFFLLENTVIRWCFPQSFISPALYRYSMHTNSSTPRGLQTKYLLNWI